jgi:hypothetical protein
MTGLACGNAGDGAEPSAPGGNREMEVSLICSKRMESGVRRYIFLVACGKSIQRPVHSIPLRRKDSDVVAPTEPDDSGEGLKQPGL